MCLLGVPQGVRLLERVHGPRKIIQESRILRLPLERGTQVFHGAPIMLRCHFALRKIGEHDSVLRVIFDPGSRHCVGPGAVPGSLHDGVRARHEHGKLESLHRVAVDAFRGTPLLLRHVDFAFERVAEWLVRVLGLNLLGLP